MKTVEVKVTEIRRVFDLLERLNDLFHQPAMYMDSDYVRQFAEKNYPELHELYYTIVWEWLPKEIQKEIEE